MRQGQFRCSAASLQRQAEEWVIATLGLVDFGETVSRGLLARLLILAASLKGSLSGVQRGSGPGPSAETVRQAVLSQLPEVDELNRRLLAGFHEQLPARLKRRPWQIAFDLHLRPYYGDRRRTPGVRGGQPKAGTKWFWTYASGVIVEHGHRWTLALTPVCGNDPPEAILERLLDQVEQAGVTIRLVLLDRGFYSAPVIQVLQERKLRFLMPVIRRGQADKGTGTQPFFRQGQSGFFTHQWRSRGKRGPLVTVRVACVPRSKRSPLVYAFQGRGWSLSWIQQTYRKRFGIETKYRQLGESLARTTSRRPSYRLLLVGLALLLRNLWVWCHTHMPEEHRPALYRLLDCLRLALIESLGVITEFPVQPQVPTHVLHSG